MKKRLISLITAVTVIFTTAMYGCDSDNKKKETSANEENAVTEEIIFRECNLADAQKISVPLTLERNNPPIELHEAELPDFMSLMPEEFSYLSQLGEDYPEPKSEIIKVLYTGGRFYIRVQYSNVGKTSEYSEYFDELYYEHAVFSFEPETGKTELIYKGGTDELSDISGNSSRYEAFDIIVADGKLYISYSDIIGEGANSYEKSVILEYNPSEGSFKEIFNEPTEMWRIYLYGSDDSLLMSYLDTDENYETRYTNKEYDCTTGQWEIISQEVPTAGVYTSYSYEDGSLIKTLYDKDGDAVHKIEREGYYRITLDEKTGKLGGNFHPTKDSLMWAEYKSVYYTSNDYIFNKYNLEDNTIYSVDVGSLGLSSTDSFSWGEDVILVGNALVHYFIPELGLVYPLVEMGQYSGFNTNEGVFSFVGKDEPSYESNNWHNDTSETDAPQYLFWFENNG